MYVPDGCQKPQETTHVYQFTHHSA